MPIFVETQLNTKVIGGYLLYFGLVDFHVIIGGDNNPQKEEPAWKNYQNNLWISYAII